MTFNPVKRFDVRVSMVYALVALLWIVLSDRLVELIFSGNQALLIWASMVKGVGFVLVTALALFVMLRSELRKRDRFERALEVDIQERNETLETLRQLELRFEKIFHGSPVPTGISRFDNAKMVDMNEALLNLFGYQRDDLIGRTSAEMKLFEYPEAREEILQMITDQGYLREHEVVGHTKTGETLHLLATSQLIELGQAPHMVSMFYNVTEQKKLEAQLQYQALLMANVSDAVISTDSDFNIRSWNPSAEAIYGWKAEEVIGKRVGDVLRGAYPHTTEMDAYQKLQTAGVWRGETMQQRKDGTRVYLMASTSVVSDSAGNRVGYVSLNRDITELVKAQQEREAAEVLRLELEKQTELLQLKENFISVVSHEFRTPLSVIISSSELMQTYYDRMTRERQLKHVEVVQTQARFMTDLLDDVLTINKARAGRLEFNPMPMNLSSFCEETVERIEVLDEGKHRLVLTQEGALAAVQLDVKLLQHIVVNLLSNAVKYSPEGGDVLLNVARAHGEVVLHVTDHGIGIPAESLEHLFEPFHRAKNTGEIRGTGLGLSIVKESVERHGGTITCASEINVGTTFSVTLPG